MQSMSYAWMPIEVGELNSSLTVGIELLFVSALHSSQKERSIWLQVLQERRQESKLAMSKRLYANIEE